MNKPKRQHTVPKFYLKRFTRNGKTLHVFDKQTLKHFQTSINDVALEKHFYDLPPLSDVELEEIHQELLADAKDAEEVKLIEELVKRGKDPQFIEKELSNREGKLAISLQELLETAEQGKKIASTLRPAIAQLMTLQKLRTRDHRHFLKQMGDFISQELLKSAIKSEGLDINPDDFQATVSEEETLRHQVASMFDTALIQILVDALCNHIWLIGESKSFVPLYTSDTPFVMRTHIPDGDLGFESVGIEILYPLNSKYVLILCERQHFKEMQSWENTKIKLSRSYSEYCNALQVSRSNRYVYCRDIDFDLAQRICAMHPEMRDPARPRIRTD